MGTLTQPAGVSKSEETSILLAENARTGDEGIGSGFGRPADGSLFYPTVHLDVN